MISLTKNIAKTGRALILCLLLATLLAMALSVGSAGAAASGGTAYAWGENDYGQLGNGTSGPGTDKNAPVSAGNLFYVKAVKAGCEHGLARIEDGTVWAWGAANKGQLGNGISGVGAYADGPVRVKIGNVKAISAGCSHNLALKENGTVWAWGSNNYGELGIGTSGTDSYTNVPVKVDSLGTAVKGIAAGNDFSLALMKDGTVKSWGDNHEGQLGNGTYGAGTFRKSPGPVKNLSHVQSIATDSSARHVVALLGGGTVKTWGDNYSGQLGNGASLPGNLRAMPVRVANLTGVKAVAAGGTHSLALLASGRVKSWGNNNQGELGNGNHGDSASRSTPGNVIGLDNVTSISGGMDHSLAVLQSRRARSWGANFWGQLGNGASGSAADSDVPVEVKNLTGIKNMDGGFQFTLAANQ